MDNSTPSFGGWLKEKRKKRGFTQEQLASAAGDICTAAYISSLEREYDVGKKGKPTRPSEEIVEALARALDESISEARQIAGYAVTGGVGAPADDRALLAAQSAEALQMLIALPPDERAKLLAIMRAATGRDGGRDVRIVTTEEWLREREGRGPDIEQID